MSTLFFGKAAAQEQSQSQLDSERKFAAVDGDSIDLVEIYWWNLSRWLTTNLHQLKKTTQIGGCRWVLY
jgi:hypothetical protein